MGRRVRGAPLLLRRLVNQGRLGKKTGQGFFFYPRADDGFEQKETILLETRDELAILWLNRPPTNPISPQVVARLDRALGRDRVARRDPRGGRRLVELRRLLRRRRHQGVHEDDRSGGRQGAPGRRPRRAAPNGAVEQGHDRRRQLAGARRRMRAGDGLRLPDRRRVGELRPAGDQPGDHPRLRRHSAAAAPRGRGEGARDEPARRADLGPAGLRGRARQRGRSRTTSCSTPRWPGRASWAARRRLRSSR